MIGEPGGNELRKLGEQPRVARFCWAAVPCSGKRDLRGQRPGPDDGRAVAVGQPRLVGDAGQRSAGPAACPHGDAAKPAISDGQRQAGAVGLVDDAETALRRQAMDGSRWSARRALGPPGRGNVHLIDSL